MATIKQDLRAFYANQGITGKALRSALRYDLRSIRKQKLEVFGAGVEGMDRINWDKGVEGRGYWFSRALGYPSWTYAGDNGARAFVR